MMTPPEPHPELVEKSQDGRSPRLLRLTARDRPDTALLRSFDAMPMHALVHALAAEQPSHGHSSDFALSNALVRCMGCRPRDGRPR